MQDQQGDHVCTLYSNRDEQLAAAIDYIRGGLERGERCLYVCCEHSPDEFRAGLRAAGIDVEEPVRAAARRGDLAGAWRKIDWFERLRAAFQ